jgi:hypothetical protein
VTGTLPRFPGSPDDRDQPVLIEPRREVVEITDNGEIVTSIVEPVPFPHVVEVVMPQWFHGQGPPGVLVGAQPGDFYVDDLTGIYYRLT